MKSVLLDLAIDEGKSIYVSVQAEFADEELESLAQYVQLMGRVRNCTLLEKGIYGFTGLTFDKNGFSIEFDAWPRGELHELLHVLRPVTLKKERASFQRVAALLGRSINEPAVRNYLKVANRVFDDGVMSLYMQIHIGDQLLFAEPLHKTWLNGTQYHTDIEKSKAWSAFEETLGEPNSLAIVQDQLHSKVLALMNVDYLARQVLAAPNDA
jgi:hypothetical protein